MKVLVTFHSYFRDLTGATQVLEDVPSGTTLGELVHSLQKRFPKLKSMERSTLMAVDVEYQTRDYQLHDGDEVSLFPPVQGG
ncbi:MAG TPA: MoaD/ThiS family protein [Verrucomicrobiae bacterium]